MFQTEGTMVWCHLGFGSPPLLSHCGRAGAEQLFGMFRRTQLPRCGSGFRREQAESMNAGFRTRARELAGLQDDCSAAGEGPGWRKGKANVSVLPSLGVFTMSGSEVRPGRCVRELFSGRLGIRIFCFS